MDWGSYFTHPAVADDSLVDTKQIIQLMDHPAITGSHQVAVQEKRRQEAAEKEEKDTSPKKSLVKVVSAPVDFSFFQLANVEEAEKEDPRPPLLGKLTSPRGGVNKYDGQCIRLNNNQLTDVKMLRATLENLFVNADQIGWIDLSFNALKTIDDALLECPNLQILYLHANKIASIKEVDKLTQLTGLRKLTLHGNPIETEKGYKLYIVSSMPWLRNVDFSAVTKCDSRTATHWKRMNNPSKKKKDRKDDDD